MPMQRFFQEDAINMFLFFKVYHLLWPITIQGFFLAGFAEVCVGLMMTFPAMMSLVMLRVEFVISC